MPVTSRHVPASRRSRSPVTGSFFHRPPAAFDSIVERQLRIRGKNHRVRVYVLRENQAWITAEAIPGYPSGTFFFANDELKKRTRGATAVQGYRGGLSAAIRGQARHAVESYGREIAVHHDLAFGVEVMAMDLNRALFVAEVPATRAQYEETIRMAIRALGGDKARDQLKVEAIDLLFGALDPKDAAGRRNPASKTLKIWAAMHRSEDRQTICRLLQDFMRGRGSMLLYVRDAVLGMVRDLQTEAKRTAELVAGGAGAEALAAKAASLENGAERLERIVLAPYSRKSFRHLCRDLRDTAKALREERGADVRRLCERMVVSCRMLLEFHVTLEEVFAKVSLLKEKGANRDQNLVLAVREELHDLHELLKENADVDTEFARPVMPDAITHVGNALVALAPQTLDFKAAYKAMKLASRCF